MPKKDWEGHKAELIHLYITERRTLNEVQGILQRRHGFKASTRAYRMKIDEWKLTKYRSSKNRCLVENDRSSIQNGDDSSSSITSVDPSPASGEVQMVFDGINIPTGRLSCSDLLGLMKGTFPGYRFLKILLSKWQADGEYMKAALDLLDNSKYSLRTTEDPVPSLITLIERNVSSEECYVLTKALLKADIYFDTIIPFAYKYECPMWVQHWRLAARENNWEEAQNRLCLPELDLQESSKTFRDCAFIVIAEHLLEHNQRKLEALLEGVEARSLSTRDINDAECYRRQYRDILKDFQDSPQKLDRSFFTYCVHIIDFTEILAKESTRRQLELSNNNHADYQAVIPEQSGLAKRPIGDTFSYSLTNVSRVQENELLQSRAITQIHHQVPPEYPCQASLETIFISVTDVLETLQQKVDDGGVLSMREYLLSIGERECIEIFCGSSGNWPQSMFDLILQKVPRDSQTSFTKALLLAYSSLSYPETTSTAEFHNWRRVFMQESWNLFKSALRMVRRLLKRVMSEAAAQLVLDCTYMLVGERLKEVFRPRQDANKIITYGELLGPELQYRDAEAALQEELAAHWKGVAQFRTICKDLNSGPFHDSRSEMI